MNAIIKKSIIAVVFLSLMAQPFLINTVQAIDGITGFTVAPETFSPDSNGLNDTTTINLTYTTGNTLYVNIIDGESLVSEDNVMSEVPEGSGSYRFTWDGTFDNGTSVPSGTYTIKISDDASENGETEGTVTVDVDPPTISTFSIEGGAAYTTDENGNVTLTISSSGASKMKVSNYANFTGATWETYSTSKSWTLLNPSSDGEKTVFINFRDAAGANASTSDTITLDTTLAEPSLSINGGASATNETDVTLTITANGASQMKIDNDTNFENMISWIDKTSTYNFTLPSGSGSKTVYLRVRDEAGNTKTTSDTITLDITAPSNLTLSINQGSYTNSQTVNLTISAEGGPNTMYLSNNGESWTSYDYATSKSWTLSSGDGSKTVYLRVADAAGNNGSKTATITLDTTDPSPVTLSSPSDGGTLTTQTPSFSWTNPNAGAQTKWFYIQILQSGSVKQSSYTNKSTTSYTATTLEEGSYQWKVTVFDMANNSATTNQRSFTVSVDGLAVPAPTYPSNTAYVNQSAPNMPRIRWGQVDGQGTINYRYRFANSSANLSTASYSSTTSLYADLDLTDYENGDRVYWQVKAKNTTDESNYSSEIYFILDNESPVLNSILIDSNETYTTTRSITLSLNAANASWMKISENDDFSDASWVAYSSSKSFTLSCGDGTKTVYFIAKDSAVGDQGSTAYANSNTTALSDTIVLDTTGPSISNQIPSTGTISSSPSVISADYADSGSSINKNTTIILLNGDNKTSSATITSSSVSYSPSDLSDGSYWVNISVSDILGNSNYLNWSFTIDSDDGVGPGDTGPGESFIPPTGSAALISISEVTRDPTTVSSTDTVEISATITALDGIHQARVYYEVNNDLESVIMTNTSDLYSATIGPFSEGVSVTYYIFVIDENAQTQQSDNYTFTVDDTSGPSITISSPTAGSSTTVTTPEIVIRYSDSSGIDTDTVKFKVDSVDRTSSATITSSQLTFTPEIPLSFGSHTITCSVTDNQGNSNSKSWSFTITADESDVIETIDSIDKDETKEIDMRDHDFIISTISIKAAAALTNVEISCKTHNTKPVDVLTPPNTVYLYLDINTNVDEDDIDSLTISFKVAQDWFSTNNIDKNKVKLLRYHNDEWQELSSTKTSEDSSYAYFEATTTGLSIFAITGDEIQETTEPKGGFPWIFVIIGIIAAIGIAVVILIKTGYIYFEIEE